MTPDASWRASLRAGNPDRAALLAEILAAGARFGDGPVCVHGTPHFLPARSLAAWQRRLARFHRIVRALRGALLADIEDDEGLAASIGVPPLPRRWAALDPGYRSAAPLARLDTFTVDHHPRFVELNAEAPAGPGYAAVLSALFARWMGGGRWIDPVAPLLGTLRFVAREAGQRARPRIAVVDFAGGATAPELTLLRDAFRRAGHACEVADPRELTFDGDRLRAGDLPIDVVYRRALVADLVERPGDAEALLAAYAAHRVVVVNPLRTALLHTKALFALMHSPPVPLSAADTRFVHRHVPWTGLLLGRGDDAVRERARRHREELVLKPTDQHGGAGVVLGWRTTQADWERAVEGARHHVVQARVPIPTERHIDLRTGAEVTRAVGVDPFLARGRLAGFLCRLAEGELANVSGGGASQVPVFVGP